MIHQRNFQHILIDLDDTLYHKPEIPLMVRQKIERYLVEKLGIPEGDVQKLTTELYYKYGTTMAGLVAQGQKIDYDDWHAHVHHTLDYKQLLHEEPELREMLLSIDLSRSILTNADARHAAYCMERLGITDCFQSIFCFENVMELGGQQGMLTPDLPVLCKPSAKVYELVLQQLGATADTTIFIDDSPRNIAAAHELGICTVLISHAAHGPVPGADVVIQHISQLPHALPEIFLDSKQELQRRVSMEEDPALLALPVHA